MAKGETNKSVIVGLAIGLGLGLAAALLFDPNSGARRRTRLAKRAREIGNSLASLGNESGAWRKRKTERAARTFLDRVERIRSAGLVDFVDFVVDTVHQGLTGKRSGWH